MLEIFAYNKYTVPLNRQVNLAMFTDLQNLRLDLWEKVIEKPREARSGEERTE